VETKSGRRVSYQNVCELLNYPVEVLRALVKKEMNIWAHNTEFPAQSSVSTGEMSGVDENVIGGSSRCAQTPRHGVGPFEEWRQSSTDS
jgi:hypothetical protein